MVDCQIPASRYLVDPRFLKLTKKFSDIIVVGGGIAGLTASIAASEQGERVLLVTKDSLEESNSFYAQGGVAAVLHASDSFDLHLDGPSRVRSPPLSPSGTST